MMPNNEGILKTEMIMGYILVLIKSGALGMNDAAPSINQVSKEFGVASETAVKAYKKLKEKGIIRSVRGKGFFIAKTNIAFGHSIFVLFDTFSAYKETLYNGMMQKFGKKAILDMYFHHFNYRSFETLVKESIGKYTHYIILPYLNKDISPILKQIPEDKLYILDYRVKNFPCKGIYQDFENDLYEVMQPIKEKARKYQRFFFVYKEYTTVMYEIHLGLIRFCHKMDIELFLIDGVKFQEIYTGDAFLVIDDEHLVELVLKANNQSLRPGAEIGIISYNETPLKKIAAGGISVISTDFAKMGNDIAEMILENKKDCNRNPCIFIDRGSF